MYMFRSCGKPNGAACGYADSMRNLMGPNSLKGLCAVYEAV